MAKKRENWDMALEFAHRAAKKAKGILMRHYGRLKEVHIKPDAGLVSEADKESECVIKKILAKSPWKDCLAEESGMNKWEKGDSRDGLWIVDPLDGTSNYVRGFPFFAISIALQVKGEVVVGVVEAPILQQTYWASKGKGAFLNGRRLSVSQVRRLEDSFLVTGFSYLKDKELNQQIQIFNQMLHKTSSIRRAGAAALDLCMVGAGVFDAFWEKGLNPWDTAAGILVIDEAGGRTSNFHGGNYKPDMDTLVASNSVIHEKIIELIYSSLR